MHEETQTLPLSYPRTWEWQSTHRTKEFLHKFMKESSYSGEEGG